MDRHRDIPNHALHTPPQETAGELRSEDNVAGDRYPADDRAFDVLQESKRASTAASGLNRRPTGMVSVVAFSAVAALGCIPLWWPSHPPEPAAKSARVTQASDENRAVADVLDQQGGEQQTAYVPRGADILGVWVLDDGIRRIIENRPDGTATMEVQFDFFTAFRYGKRLRLDLTWTLEGELMTHEIVGGSPETGKRRLISDFGPKSYFKVINIENGEMSLVDYGTPPGSYLWKLQSDSFETMVSE